MRARRCEAARGGHGPDPSHSRLGLNFPSPSFPALPGPCPSWAGLRREALTRSPSRSPRAAGAPPCGGQRSRRWKRAEGFQPSHLWEPSRLLAHRSGLTRGCANQLFPVGLIQALSGSLGLANVPPAQAAAHSSALAATSPSSGVQNPAFLPTSQATALPQHHHCLKTCGSSLTTMPSVPCSFALGLSIRAHSAPLIMPIPQPFLELGLCTHNDVLWSLPIYDHFLPHPSPILPASVSLCSNY